MSILTSKLHLADWLGLVFDCLGPRYLEWALFYRRRGTLESIPLIGSDVVVAARCVKWREPIEQARGQWLGRHELMG